MHLLPHLVAAGARPGTDGCVHRLVAVQRSKGAHSLFDHSGRQPSPARVKHRHSPFRGDRDRQAVGGQHRQADSARRRRLAVCFGQLNGVIGRFGRGDDPPAVDLPHEAQAQLELA